MHPGILDDRQKSCLSLLAKFSANFCLVGGTAIAYHLGHRRSIDFNLFTAKPFDRNALARTIRSFAPIELVFIDDIDYSESISYLPGFETPDETARDFLTKASIA